VNLRRNYEDAARKPLPWNLVLAELTVIHVRLIPHKIHGAPAKNNPLEKILCISTMDERI